MVYFQTDRGVLHQGHVMEVLKSMGTESVHCVVTSPPYWGLRDYGIEPQVWDPHPRGYHTDHIWGDEITRKVTAISDKTGLHNDGRKTPVTEKYRETLDAMKPSSSQGQFCQLQSCQAWRGSLGLEPTPELFISHIVQVFREVRRVLHPSGVCFVNLGDSYAQGGKMVDKKELKQREKIAHTLTGGGCATWKERGNRAANTAVSGLKPKDLCGIPWRVALALQADGWYLRSAMPWVKRSAMPESATDRPASALEYVFLLTKNSKYFFDNDAIRVKGPQLGHYRKDGRSGSPKSKTTLTDEKMVNPGFREKFDNPSGRNYRNTDLFYESIKPPHGLISTEDELIGLDVNPQAMKEAHFATFPEKLVEPLIKAGTSEKGCCPECGEPWVRIIEKQVPEMRNVKSEYPGDHSIATQKYKHNESGTQSKTIGWKPGCKCLSDDPLDGRDGPRAPFEPIPCTVLDPFFGSGTVAVVAEKHRRSWVGIELSTDYCGLSKDRITESIKQRCLF